MTAVGDEEVDSADTEERAEGSAPVGDTEDTEDTEDAEATEDADEQERRPGMTPRQARRIRMVTSGVVMVAVAVALVVRLGSAPSLLTVGGYGIALILSGTAIVLSRRGRTRVATAVLACGFLMVIVAERLLSSTA